MAIAPCTVASTNGNSNNIKNGERGCSARPWTVSSNTMLPSPPRNRLINVVAKAALPGNPWFCMTSGSASIHSRRWPVRSSPTSMPVTVATTGRSRLDLISWVLPVMLGTLPISFGDQFATEGTRTISAPGTAILATFLAASSSSNEASSIHPAVCSLGFPVHLGKTSSTLPAVNSDLSCSGEVEGSGSAITRTPSGSSLPRGALRLLTIRAPSRCITSAIPA